nr:Rha family transcriptional regulator [Methylobacterium sp. 37f]
MFVESTYVDPENGRVYDCYLMDRDGFALLAMAFTGPRALRWKLAYSAAFNAMERQLRERAPSIGNNVRDPNQLVVITTQLLALTQELTVRAETAEAEVAVKSEALAIAAPKVEAFEAFMSTGKNENLRSVARLCKARSHAWFAWAKDRGLLFYEGGVLQPRADLRADGYAVVAQAPDDDGVIRLQTRVPPPPRARSSSSIDGPRT